MREREPTIIEVSVIDFTELEEQAAKKWGEDNPDKKNVTAKVLYTWGFVDTPTKGRFILCDEGVIEVKPVSKENPVSIQVHTEYDNPEKEGSRCGELIPAFMLSYDDEYIAHFPIKEEKINLAEFIRVFGSRMEGNYRECLDHLKKKLGKRGLKQFEKVPETA